MTNSLKTYQRKIEEEEKNRRLKLVERKRKEEEKLEKQRLKVLVNTQIKWSPSPRWPYGRMGLYRDDHSQDTPRLIVMF